MPKAPRPQPGDLDEVERAISVLEGRHPEHERTRRETLAAAEQRRRVLEQELSKSARRRRMRAVVIAANVLAVAAAATVGWRVFTRTRALRGALERVEAPYLALGMAELASNELTARSVLEADAPGASCFVAVSTADASLRVRSGATSADARGTVGWCACAAGHVSLVTSAGGDADVGLALLRIDARTIGGPLARSWMEFPPATWAAGGEECADAMLEAWIADHRWPKSALDDGWLDAAPARAVLRQAGFHVVSGVEAGRPFGVVEGAAADCMLAVPGGDESLALRAPGGATLIPSTVGPIAWCSAIASTALVWRDGRSPVVVLSAPAAHVGGLLGTRESASDAGLSVAPAATWLRSDDLAWDAASLLRASKLADVVAGALPSEPSGASDSRIGALALAPSARVVSDPPGVVVACDPPLEAPGQMRESVCAQAAALAWWRQTDAPASRARAPLPFWLSALESHREADAIARIPELLGLARHLARRGFEPTLLEGVTELSDGVRVVGRAGEDSIVAVGLGPMPPWVFPYTDRVPWDLGDEPRVIALRPGDSVKLSSTPPANAPVDRRRTVVFRHTAVH